jgi:hypothetical protein
MGLLLGYQTQYPSKSCAASMTALLTLISSPEAFVLVQAVETTSCFQTWFVYVFRATGVLGAWAVNSGFRFVLVRYASAQALSFPKVAPEMG